MKILIVNTIKKTMNIVKEVFQSLKICGESMLKRQPVGVTLEDDTYFQAEDKKTAEELRESLKQIENAVSGYGKTMKSKLQETISSSNREIILEERIPAIGQEKKKESKESERG